METGENKRCLPEACKIISFSPFPADDRRVCHDINAWLLICSYHDSWHSRLGHEAVSYVHSACAPPRGPSRLLLAGAPLISLCSDCGFPFEDCSPPKTEAASAIAIVDGNWSLARIHLRVTIGNNKLQVREPFRVQSSTRVNYDYESFDNSISQFVFAPRGRQRIFGTATRISIRATKLPILPFSK